MFKVAALYKFSLIEDPNRLQTIIRKKFKQLEIYGTILVGKEGLNGTISGKKDKLEHAIIFIKSIEGFENVDIKFSNSKINPFVRLKIKLKNEIVTIGDNSINPNEVVGEYVDPKDWNDLIQDKDTILIDTRNDYEYSIGTFKNSINPNTVRFREFPDWVRNQNFTDEDKKNKKVAMFCTGGIRCEKASSMMLKDGFEHVHHLKGGILNYFEKIDKDQSLFNGECFVFDNRVAVKHDLTEGSYDMCHGCRMPITDEDKLSKEFIRGVSCPACFAKTTKEQKARYMSRQKQVDLAKKRNQKHIGPKEEVQKNTT
ncbi:rhodanese-related sulfurtransferase [Gammaproteobacteria bacterium]|nr:rhodanese-related sulfurtransferase [Gammaproteobacteria bacterium]